MRRMTYLTIEIYNCFIEVTINDIVLSRESKENIINISIPIHQYLVNSRNSLCIIAQSVSKQGALSASAYANVRVANFEVGSFLDDSQGETLTTINFHASKKNMPLKDRYEYENHFNSEGNTSWAWESATFLTLNEPLLLKANQFMKQVNLLVKEKKVNVLNKLYATVYRETTECYPAYTLEERFKDLAEYISSQEAPFDILKFDEKKTAYRLSADGRLLECLGQDMLPILRTEISNSIEKNYKELPMLIGLVNNEFQILR